MALIPCCNFPTILLVLDDDLEFSNGLKYGVKTHYKCICFDGVEEARRTITDNQGWVKSLWTDAISRIYQDIDPSLFSVSMDVSLLKNQLYNPNRFNHIAILIVDYDMPEQNGLDFIRSLGDHQIKIIMLTGKAGQDTVIKAFNDQEIDRYVSKGDPDYIQTILQSVNELQNNFFMDASKFIIDSLKIGETEVFATPEFHTWFNQIIKDYRIVEYYLLDEMGSFFFQDANAENQIGLIVKSSEELRNLYDLSSNDKDCALYVTRKLHDREILPYFKNHEESHLPAKEWNLFDAQPLDESKKYYYALVKNSKDLGLDQSKIKSYSNFLQEKSGLNEEAC